MTTNSGQFKKGEHRGLKTEFKKGEHWRKPKPYWDAEWLRREYIDKNRTASEIAAQFGITETAIYFWLNKHGITARTISEIRSIKHWGVSGKDNPMYGKKGILNPHWKGGLTPFRQVVYSSREWKSFSKAVRKRDKVCRLCGSHEKTEIHHIDPISQAPLLIMDIGNAILLCAKCHRKMMGKERKWKKKLLRLLRDSI